MRNNGLLLLQLLPTLLPTLRCHSPPTEPACAIRLRLAAPFAGRTRPNEYCCSKQIDMFVASCRILATYQHAMRALWPFDRLGQCPVKICAINWTMQMAHARPVKRFRPPRASACEYVFAVNVFLIGARNGRCGIPGRPPKICGRHIHIIPGARIRISVGNMRRARLLYRFIRL